MLRINAATVVQLLSEVYPPANDCTEPNFREIELKEHLQEVIDTWINSADVEVNVEYDLSIDEKQVEDTSADEDSDEPSSQSQPGQSSESSFSPPSPDKRQKGRVEFSYKKKAVEFWKSGKSKPLSFKTVQHRYKDVKTRNDLYRWEKQVQKQGTKSEKLHALSSAVFLRFTNAKNQKLIVHDEDLRRWAFDESKKKGLNDFKASVHWLTNFKKAHKIVSRKITKFIAQVQVEKSNELIVTATDFVHSCLPLLEEIGPNNVFNTDQSGFNLEIHSGRTLDVRGTKTVEAAVQSVASTTHSYTIQPFISAGGVLMSPLLIVTKETKDEFGPVVKKNLFQAPNVLVFPSKSGKMSKELLHQWFQKVYIPQTGQNTVLLVDSWTGYKDQEPISDLVPEDKQLIIKVIPEGTTKLVQPLDVYTFRQWKLFARKFSDFVLLHQADVCLRQRNNIIKLQSLIHLQFSSPRFVKMLQYAWYSSGYLKDKPDTFVNPAKFCFDANVQSCSQCSEQNLLICSWCKSPLCFTHFFTEYHNCQTFIP